MIARQNKSAIPKIINRLGLGKVSITQTFFCHPDSQEEITRYSHNLKFATFMVDIYLAVSKDYTRMQHTWLYIFYQSVQATGGVEMRAKAIEHWFYSDWNLRKRMRVGTSLWFKQFILDHHT